VCFRDNVSGNHDGQQNVGESFAWRQYNPATHTPWRLYTKITPQFLVFLLKKPTIRES
jgi:hypothetical protein